MSVRRGGNAVGQGADEDCAREGNGADLHSLLPDIT
jgi:hypothetical protein